MRSRKRRRRTFRLWVRGVIPLAASQLLVVTSTHLKYSLCVTRPIVIAYHLIWTAYGWWLPNDPRGSTSRAIATDLLAELGELHYGRKKVQPASHEIREFYERAVPLLKFALLEFRTEEIQGIAAAFSSSMSCNQYTCYACTIMPDHVHVLIRKHRHKAEEMVANLQQASRLRLCRSGLRSPDHPVWGGPGWKVFLDDPDGVYRTIRYIEANRSKLGLARQRWDFVKDYDGWPLHPSHNPNSPYVRRLGGRER